MAEEGEQPRRVLGVKITGIRHGDRVLYKAFACECGGTIRAEFGRISDWGIPGISGTDFLHEAATVCLGSFRATLTGLAQVGDVFPEISSGVIRLFIPKPWTE